MQRTRDLSPLEGLKQEQRGNHNLTLANLTLKKEKQLFFILLILSLLMWGLATISIFGIVIALSLGFMLWIGNGLLAASLKSGAIEVCENQMPQLYNSLLEACKRLGISKTPHLYITQAGGLLNAFAMRHATRDFIVLYSDALETFGPHSKETLFILGHELGHIKQKHVFKHILLFPSLLLPLLGQAYRRACEITCDRYGAFVCGDLDPSIKAMLAITGGKELYKELDANTFANQHHNNRGFFVSLHELLSLYPTPSKRVYNLITIRDNHQYKAPRKHFLAYYFVGSQFIGAIILLAFLAMIIPQGAKEFTKAFKDELNKHTSTAAINDFNLGLEHLNAQEWNHAEDNFISAINQANPANTEFLSLAYINLAVVNESKGDYEKAVAYWKDAAQNIDPSNANYKAIQGRLALFNDDFEKSHLLIGEALKAEPENQIALSTLQALNMAPVISDDNVFKEEGPQPLFML